MGANIPRPHLLTARPWQVVVAPSADERVAVGRKACLCTKMSVSLSATATQAAFSISCLANLSEHLCDIHKTALVCWPPVEQGLIPHFRHRRAGPPAGGLSLGQACQHQQQLSHSHTQPCTLPVPSRWGKSPPHRLVEREV